MRAAWMCLVLCVGCGGHDVQLPDEYLAPRDLGDVTVTPSGGFVVATAVVHVHYPPWTAQMDLLTDLDEVSVPVACEVRSPGECDATIMMWSVDQKPMPFRPRLGGVPSRGARYLVDRGGEIDVYPHFSSTVGKLETLFTAFHSTVLEPFEPSNARIIQAYLPASYAENTLANYPVIYMHDGRNLFDATVSPAGVEWQIDETVEAAWEQTGAFAEFIVIAIDEFVTVSGTLQNRRQGEYNPTPIDLAYPHCGDEYVQMIAMELKPQVDMMLRTKPDRDDTALGGSSLGQSISAWATHVYPAIFGKYIGLSPATGIDTGWLVPQLGMPSPNPGPMIDKIYLDTGTGEGDPVSQFANMYRGLGYVDGVNLLTLYELDGLHNEYAWARRLPAAFAFVFPDQRLP